VGGCEGPGVIWAKYVVGKFKPPEEIGLTSPYKLLQVPDML